MYILHSLWKETSSVLAYLRVWTSVPSLIQRQHWPHTLGLIICEKRTYYPRGIFCMYIITSQNSLVDFELLLFINDKHFIFRASKWFIQHDPSTFGWMYNSHQLSYQPFCCIMLTLLSHSHCILLFRHIYYIFNF